MRMLFLNPNSDASITATFRQRIDALARAGEAYEVARLPAPPASSPRRKTTSRRRRSCSTASTRAWPAVSSVWC